jgi:hypothetical protein
VRREDLHSPASSPRSTPDPELEELLRSRIHDAFTFTTIDIDIANDTAGREDAANSDPDETELRLFATAPNAAPTTHKIRLSSPGADSGDACFVVKRPRSYYFAENPTSEEASRLQAAAVDGKTVLELSSQPWPGCALPWKVRTISPAGLKKEVLVGHPPKLATVAEMLPKRTRKGKKTRIALRKKTQTAKEKREEQARLAKDKDEAEREKRTRRNREKKLKKKAKSQAKKLEGVEGIAESTEAGGDESMQDD